MKKTKRRARETVYWSGINEDIAITVKNCDKCRLLRPSHCKEPMITNDAPTRVFEVVSSDLFTYGGRHYLVYVDILSGWPVVYDMTTLGTTSKGVIKAIRKSFADLGVPNILKTDGGLQYTSREFKEFLQKYGVKHIVSSPHNPQSNGHAESSVKSMKHLIQKTTEPGQSIDNEKFQQALLEYRNCPTVPKRMDFHQLKSYLAVLYGHVCLLIAFYMMLNGPRS